MTSGFMILDASVVDAQVAGAAQNGMLWCGFL